MAECLISVATPPKSQKLTLFPGAVTPLMLWEIYTCSGGETARALIPAIYLDLKHADFQQQKRFRAGRLLEFLSPDEYVGLTLPCRKDLLDLQVELRGADCHKSPLSGEHLC